MGNKIVRLTTIGRKSGQPRTVLLYAFPAGDDYAVVGSNLGDDANPLWYLNLKANPSVMAELDGKRFDAVPRELQGEERENLWETITTIDPSYAVYQSRTERVLPVIVLEPRKASDG